jgi:hypothetical protein
VQDEALPTQVGDALATATHLADAIVARLEDRGQAPS